MMIQSYRHRKIRFVQMFLVAMTTFGDEYSFNNPQALQQSFQHDLKINQAQFDMLYSAFAFPNIFTSFIIGYLIDFFGVRVGIISLSIGVAVAQTIIAIGGFTYSYNTILIGRIFFGIASGSLFTAQASMMTIWFRGKQLAFAIGIAITFPQLGNALNSYMSPLIYSNTNSLGTPLITSLIICVVGVICAMIAAEIDIIAENHDITNNVPVQSHDSSQQSIQKIQWKDLRHLRWQFWLIAVIGIIGISEFQPFMDNANRLYQKRFCFNQIGAGQAIMITYIITVLLSPIIGYIVDMIGYKRYFIIITMFIYTIGHLIVLVYRQCSVEKELGSISGLIIIGIGYVFYANCVVPVIPYVVRKKITSTAFGITQSLQAIALTIFPLLEGIIVSSSNTPEIGYIHSQLFFLCLGLSGIFFSCGLFFFKDKLKMKLDIGTCNRLKRQVTLEEESQSSENMKVDLINTNKTDQQISNELNEELLVKNKYEIQLQL